ncbi:MULTISPECIES: hypothetical protein [Dehalobacter]|jgi:hypothetical protein|uniref:Prenylated flavin chaperone LpdD-like domain-containing protein n=1 Tax=Dehalobacter restrictus (strain DSM 9455 / PER-K23) TaxID=871738 RepID=A0ABM5P735_DEHRP|nr:MULTISPECIES: hypothetical protein [Dehalobacter]AFV05193.1 hypothetical protein DCF50_p1188 [Dehalobacter sp. CF]AHF10390.1 hypothetical protein DEHRE_10125 [Dehalobacter restrictus DSM 9455]
MNIDIGQDKLALSYDISIIGHDIVIIVTGGKQHIGSIAVGNCGTVTQYTVEGHRDDALAEPLAQEVSKLFNCICLVSAGFHQDNLAKEEIEIVLQNHRQGIRKVVAYLKENYAKRTDSKTN